MATKGSTTPKPKQHEGSLFARLFLQRKFGIHRIWGLGYLVQWFAALCLYWWDYERFEQSFLVWSLPLSGLIQTIIACRTFHFLPKGKTDQGYYTSGRVMSYDFMAENLFFSGILLWQWLYFTDRINDNLIKRVPPIEYVLTFFPYQFRWLFPKTSFRKSLNDEKNENDVNRKFFYIATIVTKIFYVWAKHFIGLFLNYVRFLDRLQPEQQYHLYFMLIMSCCATTISMFLQTLKFKGYMGPKTSFVLYMISYLSTFYSFIRISGIFIANYDLAIFTIVGIVVNFSPKYLHGPYQVFVAISLTAMKFGHIPIPFTSQVVTTESIANVSHVFLDEGVTQGYGQLLNVLTHVQN